MLAMAGELAAQLPPSKQQLIEALHAHHWDGETLIVGTGKEPAWQLDRLDADDRSGVPARHEMAGRRVRLLEHETGGRGVNVTRLPTTRRHSADMIAQARLLAAGGWRPQAIARMFAAEGRPVHRNTVQRWVDDTGR